MVSNPEASDIFSHITVANRFPERLLLIIEPLATEIWMERGEVFDVIAQGPPGGKLDLKFFPDRVIIYTWSGSLIAIYCDGVRVDGWDKHEQPRVPPVPRRTTEH